MSKTLEDYLKELPGHLTDPAGAKWYLTVAASDEPDYWFAGYQSEDGLWMQNFWSDGCSPIKAMEALNENVALLQIKW